MQVHAFSQTRDLGTAAADQVVEILIHAIRERGQANSAMTAGSALQDLYESLAQHKEVEWNNVRMFQLCEFGGLSGWHKSSLRKRISEHFLDALWPSLEPYWIEPKGGDLKDECLRLQEILEACPLDLVVVDIRERAQIGFNFPPAVLERTSPYQVVEFDEFTRKEMVEKWHFRKLKDVPARGITMSLPQIGKARMVVACASGVGCAEAIRDILGGGVEPSRPASVLNLHPDCHLFVDREALSFLAPEEQEKFLA